uniref:Chemokine interleukin-8-like domain-containing protein n=1 Tax=Periophthalmus magnuspinnatus TaxID=409849 RepID=A0A3B3ZW53_9GOBI
MKGETVVMFLLFVVNFLISPASGQAALPLVINTWPFKIATDAGETCSLYSIQKLQKNMFKARFCHVTS